MKFRVDRKRAKVIIDEQNYDYQARYYVRLYALAHLGPDAGHRCQLYLECDSDRYSLGDIADVVVEDVYFPVGRICGVVVSAEKVNNSSNVGAEMPMLRVDMGNEYRYHLKLKAAWGETDACICIEYFCWNGIGI